MGNPKLTFLFYVVPLLINSNRSYKINNIINEVLIDDCTKYIGKIPSFSCFESTSIFFSDEFIIFKVVTKNQLYTMKVEIRTIKSFKEIKILKAVSHCSYVAPLVKAFMNEEIVIIVMPFYQRGNLETAIWTIDGHFTYFLKQKIVNNLVSALVCMYNLKIVHRDISIFNIVFDTNYTPHLINFHKAVFIGEEIQPKVINHYVSPEIISDYQLLRKHIYTGTEDIYAMGVVFYYMVQHRFPVSLKKIESEFIYEASIIFDTGDKLDFIDIIKSTVVTIDYRVNIFTFYTLMDNKMENPNLQTIKSSYFYTMDNPNVERLEDTNKLVLYLVLGFIGLVFICGVGLSFFLCCKVFFKCLFPCLKSKKKGRDRLYEGFEVSD